MAEDEANGRKKRRYDDAFRATALLFLATAGGLETPGAVERAAKALQIPQSTLRDWAKGQAAPPAEIRAEKRIDLAEAIRRELDGALGTMPGKRGEASYRDLAVTVGILVDKLQLLQGEPTERTAWTVS